MYLFKSISFRDEYYVSIIFFSKGSIISVAPQGEFDVLHICPLNSQISLHIALAHGAIYHVYAL